MGNPPEATGALNAMAAALLEDGATLENISAALKRCRKECRFPVRLPDIYQRIPGFEVSQPEGEMRAAWDVLVQYTKKWVHWPIAGGRMHASPDQDAPKLPQRSLDCVRRSGGWDCYLTMNPESMPFLQKRFFEEWQAWKATESFVGAQFAALCAPQVKQLSEAKRMEPTEPCRLPAAVIVPMKNIPQEAMTPIQMRDRREMLRQQSAQIEKRGGSR